MSSNRDFCNSDCWKFKDLLFCKDAERDEIREMFEGTNQNKAATSFIRQYAVYEHLGTGAFGSVYKVSITVTFSE